VTPIAHTGHWTSAFIYLAPVLIVVAVLFVQERRQRRRDVESGGDEGV
jgi:hypothetical protein